LAARRLVSRAQLLHRHAPAARRKLLRILKVPRPHACPFPK
jgi:hypothetical protein